MAEITGSRRSRDQHRPARKDYNKLTGGEEQSKSDKSHATSASEDEEQLDNQDAYRGIDESGNHISGDSDTDSSFTDIEMDNRDDFSDDSDYGKPL
ncbi:unnamed protein product [Acanthoscelides obtectus]|uniref:Uncharacterized protein n=1 Tax=Acanthoscelides obtectus TaxID=200917 RepID=A0A9P0K6D1_ACAOB|nr:unnamed protein product [Acanthoscelides obtectus]CAK1633293.1 hypothetical protein AOBTE_LOCUS8022 [Acanthoscelides obtectus]